MINSNAMNTPVDASPFTRNTLIHNKIDVVMRDRTRPVMSNMSNGGIRRSIINNLGASGNEG